ncbi:MAG TPA: ABC transporter ATP-binding protein [Xanthobacteraceae bacterium]
MDAPLPRGHPAHPTARRSFAPWRDPAASPLLRLDRLSKHFAGSSAVEELSLDIFSGEFFALLGPSGCGKTTLLRLLAGFEKPDRGRILLGDEDLVPVPPHRRPVNMMFQSYALFPHLSIEGNIAFGLKQEGLPAAEIATRVAEMLALVKLEGLGRRKPHQLSGGQRQRVALARSLVKRPRLLLLDEPLAALDKKLRGETQLELMQLHARLGLTFIIVTHDQQEAMTVADRIAVMDKGRLIQVATPREIYEQPGSCWVADFIGEVNLIEGRLVQLEGGGVVASAAAGPLRVAAQPDAKPGDTVWVAVRPEKLRIGREQPSGRDGNRLAGQVAQISYLGDLSLYQVRLESGFVMKAALPNVLRLDQAPIGLDERVWLSWPPEAAVLLTR